MAAPDGTVPPRENVSGSSSVAVAVNARGSSSLMLRGSMASRTGASLSVMSDIVMSILMIWTPLSVPAATAAYVWPPDSNVAMARAPPSVRAASSAILPAEVTLAGSVTSSNWTPLSPYSPVAATAAYVWPPVLNMVMSRASLSSRSSLSVMLPAEAMLDGSVTSSIWTLLSPYWDAVATAAYVRVPDSNMAMARAPSSTRSLLSVMLPARAMLEGSVTLSIWIFWGYDDIMATAYV